MEVCSGLKSWLERALLASNIRIKDIIILINFPRPVSSAFIICRDEALSNRTSLFGSPAWGERLSSL
jgi:hypothetical protein